MCFLFLFFVLRFTYVWQCFLFYVQTDYVAESAQQFLSGWGCIAEVGTKSTNSLWLDCVGSTELCIEMHTAKFEWLGRFQTNDLWTCSAPLTQFLPAIASVILYALALFRFQYVHLFVGLAPEGLA